MKQPGSLSTRTAAPQCGFFIKKSSRRLVGRALKAGKPVIARVTIRVTDTAGNTTTRNVRVRGKR